MKRSRLIPVVLLGATILVSGTLAISHHTANTASVKSEAPQSGNISKASNKQSKFDKPRSTMMGSVDNIVKISEEANLITLGWDETRGATGYFVYVCDKDESDSYTLIADVSKPSADIMNLKDTTKYWFKVSAYTEKDGVIYETPAAVFKTATQAGEVNNLDSERSSSVLKIKWDKIPKATAYEVYRADKKTNSEYVLCTVIQNDQKTVYEDKDVKEGELYSYKIRPYRIIDNLQYCAKGKTIDLISGLSAPSNLIARSANTRVTLNWDEKELATCYNVYISENEKSGFKLIGTTEDTSFSTEKLKAGTTYYFRVQSCKKLGGGKTVNGTWSTCSIKAAKDEENTRSAPKSTISGKGTYIEVSIAQQHMWFYKDGKLMLDTDVVTGNADGECDTPTGNFSVESMARDTTLTGPGYSSFVNYWMGFYGGCGIHDASWRSSFGGDIYRGNGSHGCVNTPYEKVKKIYENVEYGTPVYVY